MELEKGEGLNGKLVTGRISDGDVVDMWRRITGLECWAVLSYAFIYIHTLKKSFR